MIDLDEKQAFDRVINVLTEHNYRLSKDYIIKHYNDGCFYIEFCPRQFVILDVEYFYERIPDIVVFKIFNKHGVMNLNIKIRLRRE